MNKEYLKNVIIDQKEFMQDCLHTEKIVSREGAAECKKSLAYPNILLVSGLRRSGKSFFSHLLAGNDAYASINFDDERLIGFKPGHFNTLLESFYELADNYQYLLFDEIQNIKGWELFVSRLRQKYKIMITGSNAGLLSSELATHLTGRFSTHTVFPMSFREFLAFQAAKPGKKAGYSTRARARIEALFSQYIRTGGIFEYYRFGAAYLRSLFSSIITKDVLGRYAIKYPAALEELAVILINSFGSKVSANRIAASLKVKSSHTIKEYMNFLSNTFLFFPVSKFSYKLKEQYAALKKMYVVDNGIINSLIFDFSSNKGRLLENIVALELKRQSLIEHSEVFYWDDYRHECDFIVKKGKKITAAFQVCYQLSETNKTREFAGLTEALHTFKLKKGVILTMSDKDTCIAGELKIEVMPVWEWILSQSA